MRTQSLYLGRNRRARPYLYSESLYFIDGDTKCSDEPVYFERSLSSRVFYLLSHHDCTHSQHQLNMAPSAPVETFEHFIEGQGPGPRGDEDCMVCLDTLTASKPSISHANPSPTPCLATFCRSCFMHWVLQNKTSRKCPSCRAPIEVNMDERALIEDIGTDGRHDGAFWPRLGGIDALTVGRVSRDVAQRAYSLQDQAVRIGEYDDCFFLERAIICSTLPSFLDIVIERGMYLHARDPLYPILNPNHLSYIRFNTRVSVNFVRWLHGERDRMSPAFMRWALRNESLLDEYAKPLSRLVQEGLFGTAGGWPVNAECFRIFWFHESYYLVPDTMAHIRTPLEQRFWNIGSFAFQKKGWMQLREHLAFSAGVRGEDPGPDEPPYVVNMQALGVSVPIHPPPMFIQWPRADDGQHWPVDTDCRDIGLWDDYAHGDDGQLCFQRAVEDMPTCPPGLVDTIALRQFATEEHTREVARGLLRP